MSSAGLEATSIRAFALMTEEAVSSIKRYTSSMGLTRRWNNRHTVMTAPAGIRPAAMRAMETASRITWKEILHNCLRLSKVLIKRWCLFFGVLDRQNTGEQTPPLIVLGMHAPDQLQIGDGLADLPVQGVLLADDLLPDPILGADLKGGDGHGEGEVGQHDAHQREGRVEEHLDQGTDCREHCGEDIVAQDLDELAEPGHPPDSAGRSSHRSGGRSSRPQAFSAACPRRAPGPAPRGWR